MDYICLPGLSSFRCAVSGFGDVTCSQAVQATLDQTLTNVRDDSRPLAEELSRRWSDAIVAWMSSLVSALTSVLPVFGIEREVRVVRFVACVGVPVPTACMSLFQQFETYLRPFQDMSVSVRTATATTIQEAITRRETVAERIVERTVIDFQTSFSQLCSDHCKSAHSLDALFESLLFRQLSDCHNVRVSPADQAHSIVRCNFLSSLWPQEALAAGTQRLEQACCDHVIRTKHIGLLTSALTAAVGKLTDIANQTIESYVFPFLSVVHLLSGRVGSCGLAVC
jgi:hypothetical protein